MSTTLRECPFCAAPQARIIQNLVKFQVNCRACGAAGPELSSQREAMHHWNTLAAELTKSRELYAHHFTEKLRVLEASWQPNPLGASKLISG